MKIVKIVVLGFSLALASAASAQHINIDLGKLDSQTAASVLDAKKQADKESIAAIPKAMEWAETGTAVATALSATAKALSVEVNEFVKTPVGKWAMIFLFWYLLGHKIWAIVGGTLVWVTLMTLIVKSYRRMFITRRILVSETGVGINRVRTYAESAPYKFTSAESRGGAIGLHVGLGITTTLLCMGIVFT